LDFAFDLKKRATRNNPQLRPASLAGTEDHAAVELTFHTFTSRLSALAFELIDGSLDHRLIGEERLDEISNLTGEMAERLAPAGELLSLSSLLYAHYYISIQIMKENATKNRNLSKKIFARAGIIR
jgi:hypothetical protein